MTKRGKQRGWRVHEFIAPTPTGNVRIARRKRSVHFRSTTDLWSTPQALFDTLNAEFGFTRDVCALPDNAKCAAYFTPIQDGLQQVWTGSCWCNPP